MTSQAHLAHLNHLTDAQFTDLLSGTETPDILHHLHACPTCAEEFERVRSSMESFNDISLAWAQREASTRVPVPAIPERRWFFTPAWSMAGGLAAVLAVAGLAAGTFLDHSHHTAAPAAVEVAAAAPTDASISDDNRLMAAIDDELRRPDPAVAQAEALGAPHIHPKERSSRRAID